MERTIVNYENGIYNASEPDEDLITSYDYDEVGNQVLVTDSLDRETGYGYDDLNRVETITNPLSGVTTYTYDPAGNRSSVIDAENQTTTYGYDKLNRVVTTTNALSGITLVAYDAVGNRLSVTDARDNTTSFDYDSLYRLESTTDAANQPTHFTYDALGNRRTVTDAEERTTTYGYDSLNRVVTTTNALSGTTVVIYDPVGNRLSVTDPKDHTTSYIYDDLDRLVATTDPNNLTTVISYDGLGNCLSVTNAANETTQFGYDRVNRLTLIRDPLDNETQYQYDGAGNRVLMIDGTGTTTYTYDALYRLDEVDDGAFTVGYDYDAVGNRTHLTYPNGEVVTYTYDAGNRLETVTDWRNGQYGYDYDQANRLTDLSLPNGVESGYSYDDSGRLTLLAHQNITETLASYSYSLDRVGNRTTLTETVEAILAAPTGAYLENGGLVVIEAEHFSNRYNGPVHQWLLKTNQSGYTGTSYLQPLPDRDTLYASGAITDSPRIDYPVSFTTPGTYTLWLRGYPTNARGDSAYVGFTPGSEPITATGFVPRSWSWARASTPLAVTNTGIVTLSLWMREDGLRLDRLVLTTDTAYIPNGFGLTETERLTGTTGLEWLVDRTIEYEYDNLYRLTQASYTSGALYQYDYDPVGNRLQQIINGDTTSYQYDVANRLEQVNGQSYSHDANGNLLATGMMTNTFDAANRLVSSTREGTTVQPIYNGIGNRVGQTVGTTTTHFALDVRDLPEVIYTSEGAAYLHLPGVVMAEKEDEVRYLLSDGLGSIRQATDDAGAVVAYNEFDPYGNPVQVGSQPYGFTGEWWENDLALLHLRARWYLPEAGRFLSRDPLFTMAEYAYASNNPINRVDPSGLVDWGSCRVYNNVATCHLEDNDQIWPIAREVLDSQGVPNAWDEANAEVNSRIANVMEPRMWDLNPHLHPVGVPPRTNVGLWRCPACRDNPTISAEAPYGIINLPPSWLPGITAGPPSPPIFTIDPPIFAPPSSPPANPPLIGPSIPVGPGTGQYTGPVHPFREDGFVVGMAWSFNTWIPYIHSKTGRDAPPPIKYDDVCLTATGFTEGTEWVYDFKHQESGTFEFSGSTRNIATLLAGGGAIYVGKTKGFAHPFNTYRTGVEAYSGGFKSETFQGPFGEFPGGFIIEAAPLDQNNNVNPAGVFATYHGITLSGGLFPSQVSYEVAVTNYELISRNRYLPNYVNANDESQVLRIKMDITHRKQVARVMEQEMREQVVGIYKPLGAGMLDQAIVDLWDFVDEPGYPVALH